jgi:hypothetical protein
MTHVASPLRINPASGLLLTAFTVFALLFSVSPSGADTIHGRVMGGGAPIARSTVTLMSASADSPKQLAQVQTGDDGQFSLKFDRSGSPEGYLYLIAKGGEPRAHEGGGENAAITLLAILGKNSPSQVTINEFTTVASVWTNAQFINSTEIKGPSLGLEIAAGNVPNFVDLQTGGYGVMIQDPLNSTQTPTMANFATLASVTAGCITQIKPDACGSFLAAAAGPDEKVPANTLTAAESIARNPAYRPARVFGLLNSFYPVPQGKYLRRTPFLAIFAQPLKKVKIAGRRRIGLPGTASVCLDLLRRT